MNELSENVSSDPEFALAFEIQPFKVASFVLFFKCQFFQVFLGGMGQVKKHCFSPKVKKMQFFEIFSSFPNEIDKKEQIQNFYWLIINSLSPASGWQRHRRLKGAEPSLLYNFFNVIQ